MEDYEEYYYQKGRARGILITIIACAIGIVIYFLFNTIIQ